MDREFVLVKLQKYIKSLQYLNVLKHNIKKKGIYDMGLTQNKETVLLKSKRHCALCEKNAFNAIEVHHIIPRSEGGNDDIDNLIPLCFDCHQRVGSYNPNHPKGTKYSVKELKSRRDDIYDKVRKGELPKQEVKILNAPAIVERRLKIEKDFKPIAQIVASENLFNPDIEFFSYVDILVTEYGMDSFFFESDLLCRLVELAEFLAEHTSPYRAIKPSDKNLTERLLELRKNFIEEYKRCFLIQM